MSPEQANDPRNVDHRSDLYSLGAVFYHTLTGSPPVRGTSAGSIVQAILQDIPQSPSQISASIPTHVDQACMKLLAKNPDARFQTAQEFIQAIQGQQGQVSMPAIQGCFCNACGTQILPGSRFCSNCGAQLNVSQVQTTRCLACGGLVDDSAACPHCSRLFSPADHRLIFVAGSLSGCIFRIPEGIYIIGRNELSPRDCHISRKHLSVACTNGSVFIQDAGSANKTYVGQQIADIAILLASGEQVCIAGNTATYTSN